MEGRVLSNRKGTFEVLSHANTIINCRVSTKLRKSNSTPLAGDSVGFTDNGDGTGFILELLPRKNSFLRPRVANIDCLIIVVAAAQPEPVLYYIDLMTAQAAIASVETAIIINKSDLADSDSLVQIYRQSGINVFNTQANCGKGIAEVSDYISGKTVVFSGASGVGKSSLLNALYPRLELDVGEVSVRTQRGKNTTRSARFYNMEDGTLIADTPGFSVLDITMAEDVTAEDMPFAFPEMTDYMHRCRYSKCTHRTEEGCAVIQAVKSGEVAQSRHESYIKLYCSMLGKKNKRH